MDQQNQPTLSGTDGKTLIYDAESAIHLTPAELRSALGFPSGERIQDYGVISTIGIGGVGAVFSAHEPGLNREIALKLLRPQYRNNPKQLEAFIREARITAQIDHPNIVPVHRMGVFDDVGVYFTMKRVEGETLRMVLRKLVENRPGYRRNFSLIRLLEIFLGACNGVSFAHRHGILHGDLKPGNLMVGDYGEVMVMDWGMAGYQPELDQGKANAKMNIELNVSLAQNKDSDADAAESRIGGTPAFMAPEQIIGQPRSEQTDIYALGAILYTILTWQSAPFDLELSAEEIMRAAAEGNFPLPHKVAHRRQPVPMELEAICLKAMNRDCKKRYAKVTELIADVRNYLEDYPVQAYSPNLFYRTAKLIRRHPLIPVTLAAALLTWGGFYGIGYLNNVSQSNSLINLAEYSYSQTRSINTAALRTLRLLQNSDGNSLNTRQLEFNLIAQTSEMQNGYYAALELLSRATEYGERTEAVAGMTADIFRSLIELYLMTRNYDALNNVIRQANNHWEELFKRARTRDPELAALLRKISAQTGTLRLYLEPSAKMRLTILQQDGTPAHETGPAQTVLQDLPCDKPELAFTLPCAGYILEVTQNGKTFRFPAQVPLAETCELLCNIPEKLPPDMVFIPGSNYIYIPNSERSTTSRFLRPSYLLGKYEVSFGEYLKFWKQLPPDSPEREKFRAWYPFSADSGRLEPAWNSAGELKAPFTPGSPVVGITAQAAEAYCRWYGRQFGMTGRLPTRLEWQRAARGIDARLYVWGDLYQTGRALLADHPEIQKYPAGAPVGSFTEDLSPYGAFDLNGNVRELVASQKDTPFHIVCGGSYLTDSQLAACDNLSFESGRAPDVGFRCLLELPEKN